MTIPRRRSAGITSIAIALALDTVLGSGCGVLGMVRGEPPPVEAAMSPEWYESNAPVMTDYLSTLPASSVGTPIDGIMLSDGKRWLSGLTYLGQPAGLPDGVNVRLLDDGSTVTAYVWLDPGAAPFVLQPCTEGPQRGIRARRAGGAGYAWRALEPDHGLVYTLCPPLEWLPADRPSNRPKPGA